MKLIAFRTNLDEPKDYVRRLNDTWWGMVPTIGNRITFKVIGLEDKTRTFELQVVGINWDEDGRAIVDLHIPQFYRNIPEWSAYYRRHVEGKP